MSSQWTCPSCGTDNRASAPTCTQCGADREAPPPSPGEANTPQAILIDAANQRFIKGRWRAFVLFGGPLAWFYALGSLIIVLLLFMTILAGVGGIQRVSAARALEREGILTEARVLDKKTFTSGRQGRAYRLNYEFLCQWPALSPRSPGFPREIRSGGD